MTPEASWLIAGNSAGSAAGQAPRTLLSWSSGKDAAWSLYVLRQSAINVAALVTTVNREFNRVAMHAVRRAVLERQAEATGLPLITVPLPWPCSNAEYEAALLGALAAAKERFAVSHIAFGDLFLEDVRAYRELQLAGTGLEPMFPLWGRSTRALAEEMIAGGLRAVLTCVDPRQLPPSFAGREFDAALLADLPEGVDPCGERGEFHTCVFAGPMFAEPLHLSAGEVVERDGFVFADLEPRAAAQPRDDLDGNTAPTAESAKAAMRSSRAEEFSSTDPIVRPQHESIFDSDGALTRSFLLDRGFCCGNRCRNCPYEWQNVPVSV